jgi:integrase
LKRNEQRIPVINPVKKRCGVKVPHPLPRYLKEEEIKKLFATIQDLLGHSPIATTRRYCRVSNLKVKRDYDRAMERIVNHYLLEKST